MNVSIPSSSQNNQGTVVRAATPFAKISNVHRPITLALVCCDFGAIYIVLHYVTSVYALLNALFTEP